MLRREVAPGLRRANGSSRAAFPRLQVFRRLPERAPHMRARAVVKAEAFFRLAEIAADDVLELLELDMHVGVERVKVMDADHSRRAVPFMRARRLVGPLDMRLGFVVGAEIRFVI